MLNIRCKPAYWLSAAALVAAAGCASAPPSPPAPTEPAERIPPKPTTVPFTSPHEPVKSLDPVAVELIRRCDRSLAHAGTAFNALEKHARAAGPMETLEAFNELDIIVEKNIGKAGLYRQVHPSPDVRDTAKICGRQFKKLREEIGFSRPVYDRLKSLEPTELDSTTRHYLEKLLNDFERAGLARPAQAHERIRRLRNEMADLSRRFSRNIREDVRYIELDSVEALDGLPAEYIKSHRPGEDGKIRISTKPYDYLPFMRQATADRHRLALYKAFHARGYPENESILTELIAKRHKLAGLLGGDSYAGHTLQGNMLDTPERVRQFINSMSTITAARAEQDYAMLLERLQRIDATARDIGEWQWPRLRQLIEMEITGLDRGKLHQYFLYKQVRDGIFRLSEAYFGITIRPTRNSQLPDMPISPWHESVELYEVIDNGSVIGRFYIDAYPRDGKTPRRLHLTLQSGIQGRQLPLSALIFNFPVTPPSGPARLEHRQIVGFLHEYGHMLHNMFSGRQRRLRQTASHVESDFTDVPARVLEEWAWDPETLKTLAVNSEGEPLPREAAETLNATRPFAKGLRVRQEAFHAALGLYVHHRDPDGYDLQTLRARLRQQYSLFSHVPGAGLAAGLPVVEGPLYYRHLWSDALATDLLNQHNPRQNPSRFGMRFRKTVLEPGASKPADRLIEDFLGRRYNFHAYAARINRL